MCLQRTSFALALGADVDAGSRDGVMTQRLSFAAEYLSVDRLYDGTIARGETGKSEVLTSAEVKAWCDLKDQDEDAL